MTKKLTIKEAKLVKGIAEGKTKQQAAIEAGYGNTPESASSIATETLKNPKVQEALDIAFERQGITIDKAVKPIADGLIANKIHITDSGIEHSPDHSVRLKASGMALGLMGVSGKAEGNTTVIFNQGDVVKSKYVKD